MRIEVLGPARTTAPDGPTPLPNGNPGRLLQHLILSADQHADQHSLSTTLWPDIEPGVALRRLRVTATRLRRHLSDPVRLDTTDGGYRLHAPAASFDLLEFLALAGRAHTGNRSAARRALALWRGEPFTGFTASDELWRRRAHLHSVKEHLEGVAATSPRDRALLADRPDTSLSRRHVIPRPRLVDRMPGVGAAQLLAVTAPAGLGKSVLLDQWAVREGAAVLRARLTGDDDAGLWSRLAAGLTAGPPTGRSRRQAPPPGGWDVTSVVNLVVDMAGPVGVVIDDLHLGSAAVHAQIRALLHHAPPGLTLAIASRQALPFPIGRLRAHGAATVLAATDLALTPAECADAAAAAGILLTDDRAARLHQVTAGWPRAVVPVARQLAEVPADAVPRWEPDPSDGLADGTLSGLSDDELRVVAVIAHVGPLDPDATAEAASVPDAAAILRRLCRQHLLVVERGTRYHLVAGVRSMVHGLVSHWSPNDVAALHRRAARWFGQRGLPETALGHAVTAGDRDAAATFIRPALRSALRRGDGIYLREWLPKISPTMLGPEGPSELALASCLLAPGERGQWRDQHLTDRQPAISATRDAVDLLRAGRCRRALTAAGRARRHLRREPPQDHHLTIAIETLLAVTETDSRILLGTPGDTDLDTPSQLERAPWPWLHLWTGGTRALHAYVAGHVGLARALLDQTPEHDDIDPSWHRLGNGATSIARALLAIDDATTDAERHAAVEHAERAVRRGDRRAHGPMAVVARLALQRALQRAGEAGEAAALTDDIDTGLAQHPELTFLRDAHRATVDRRGPARPADAIRDLTRDERVMLSHLASSLTLDELGATLYVSPDTVRARARSIYVKLGVKARSQAVGLLTRL